MKLIRDNVIRRGRAAVPRGSGTNLDTNQPPSSLPATAPNAVELPSRGYCASLRCRRKMRAEWDVALRRAAPCGTAGRYKRDTEREREREKKKRARREPASSS